MYISLFCVYESSIDAKSLYDELAPYKMNVTDAIKSVFIYGRFYDLFLPEIIMILLKYGDAKITITK